MCRWEFGHHADGIQILLDVCFSFASEGNRRYCYQFDFTLWRALPRVWAILYHINVSPSIDIDIESSAEFVSVSATLSLSLKNSQKFDKNWNRKCKSIDILHILLYSHLTHRIAQQKWKKKNLPIRRGDSKNNNWRIRTMKHYWWYFVAFVGRQVGISSLAHNSLVIVLLPRRRRRRVWACCFVLHL